MTDILFPPGLVPRRVTWTLERAVATFESPLSYASQRVARAGARWRASVEMPPLDQPETGLLSAWLDQISRADNCGIVPVFQNRLVGQSTISQFAEKQAPFNERDANLDWGRVQLIGPAYTSGADLAVYSTTGTSAINQARLFRTFTVEANVPYLVTIDIPPQQLPGGYAIGDTVTNLVDARSPVPGVGRFRHVVTPTTTSLEVYLTPTTGQQAFTVSRFRRVSVARAFRSAGSAAAGATIVGLRLGAPISAIALTHGIGQMVNIETATGWELVRLTADIHMISGVVIGGVTFWHQGRMEFEPSLRGAVAAEAAIDTIGPACRMRLAEPNSSATIDAPMFGGFAFDLVEWFGA